MPWYLLEYCNWHDLSIFFAKHVVIISIYNMWYTYLDAETVKDLFLNVFVLYTGQFAFVGCWILKICDKIVIQSFIDNLYDILLDDVYFAAIRHYQQCQQHGFVFVLIKVDWVYVPFE